MTEKFGAIHVDNFVCTSGNSEVVVKVSGLTTIARSGITITGDILADNITSTGNLGVSGTTTLAGVSTVNNNLNVSGLFVQNNATITGDVFISGDLTVTGTITGTVETAENLNVVLNNSNLDRFPVFSTVTSGVSLPYVDGAFKYNPSQNRLTIANLVATQSGNFGGNGIVSSGNIICGPQTGGVGLTTNDGYGNASVTFNHVAGKPDQVGNALRIKTNVDETSNPTMVFQGAVASAAGAATSLSNLFRLRETEGADCDANITTNFGSFIITADGFGITWDDSGNNAAMVYADRANNTFNIDLNSLNSTDINTFKVRGFFPMSNAFDDLLSLDANSGALTVSKVIASELERGGSITIDANGSGADITLSAADNVILNCGTEEDGAIYFRGKSGADSYRFAKSGQTAIEGFLSFESLSQDRTFTFPNSGGTIALTTSTVSNATQAANADTVDNLHASSFIRADADDNVSGHTEWQDNFEIRLGTGADFRMEFNGTDTVFRNYAHANGDIIFQGEDAQGTNQNILILDTSGDQTFCRLFFNNAEKFRTVTAGIDVTGTVVADGATFNGDVNIRTALDFADGDVLRMGSSDDWTVTFNQNGWTYINQTANGIIFQDNGTAKMRLEDSAVFRPEANNTGSIGTSSAKWANMHATTFNGSLSGTATNCSRSISGGNGLTGGGTLNTNRTLSVGAGSGISVSADAVAVDSTVIRTTGNQTKSGTMTFNDVVNIRGNIDLADNDILRLGSGDDAEFFVNGSHLYLDLNGGIGNFIIRDGTTDRYVFDDNGTLSAVKVSLSSGSRTDAAYKFSGDADTGMFRNGANDLVLVTGGNVRHRIQSSGQGLYCAQGNPTRGHIFKTSQGNNNNRYIISGNRDASAADGSGGTEVFRVRTTGGVQNNANQYTSLSDERLKENIVDAQSQWDDVKALRLVNFNFVEEVGFGPEKLLGFIAQEVEQICPQLVDTDDLDDEYALVPGQKSVRNSIIMTKAFGALQEAMARIEQLEERIAQLETP